MKQWELAETQESGTAIMEEKNIVMYLDDLDQSIMQSVVNLHNNGKSPEEIEAYLKTNEDIIDETQREFIIENINAYLKLTNMSETQELMEETAKLQGVTLTEKPLTRGEKAARTRKANAQNKPAKIKPGSSNAGIAIKALEDKIQLIKLLDGAEVIEIPSGLEKQGRDLMLEFQKEQQALIDSYLEKVQKL